MSTLCDRRADKRTDLRGLGTSCIKDLRLVYELLHIWWTHQIHGGCEDGSASNVGQYYAQQKSRTIQVQDNENLRSHFSVGEAPRYKINALWVEPRQVWPTEPIPSPVNGVSHGYDEKCSTWMTTCVHRYHQIPSRLRQAFFQRRSPKSMSIRSTRSDMSVDKMPILPRSVRRTVQDSASSSQTAREIAAPDGTHGQGIVLSRSRDRQTIHAGANISKPKDWGERDGDLIAFPEYNSGRVPCLDRCKWDDSLPTCAG